jgi:hypothetical protein
MHRINEAIIIGVGYTGVKMDKLLIFIRAEFCCVLFYLSQHNMTTFSSWDPRKICAQGFCVWVIPGNNTSKHFNGHIVYLGF